MKKIIAFILCHIFFTTCLFSQVATKSDKNEQAIYGLIDQYAKARETKDTALLDGILTNDVDQLVSSGVWRKGKDEAMQGMLQSSASNPGERTLHVDKIRFMATGSAIVDAKYQILNSDGSIRNMWSTFLVVFEAGKWKITAIRNMLPAGPQ